MASEKEPRDGQQSPPQPQGTNEPIQPALLPCQPAAAGTPLAAGQLVLVRHGESVANANRELSGWQDSALTSQGEAQALCVARQLREANWSPELAFCSVLQRARRTCQIICCQLSPAATAGFEGRESPVCPIQTSWQLNEQMYGTLVGQANRRGVLSAWNDRPPPLARSDPLWPGHEAKYDGVPRDLLPESETCLEAFDRVRGYFAKAIAPQVLAGRRVLWVGHGGVFHSFVLRTVGQNVHFVNCQPYLLLLNRHGWPVGIESCF
uniref:Phosphoglycerate mutase n=2 Tax=Macrostomum lignano TaxID=282301 RepID=A0A1I8GKI1_9PLAT